MIEDDIYICFPGEIVVYKPSISSDQSEGLLCIVQGIKKGKVILSICPTNNSNILAQPSDLIESGDYGSDRYDLKDEVGQLYEGFDESVEMDLEGPFVEQHVEGDKKHGLSSMMDLETVIFHYLSGNYVTAFDATCLVPDSSAINAKKQLYSGKCVEGLGDYERALHYYMQAFNLSEGTDSYIACRIALCYQKIGGARDAWIWCQRALQASPHSPLARFVAARLLAVEEGNDPKDCVEQLQTCILDCPVVEPDQLLSEIAEMWNEVAVMAQALNCDSKICIRARLRVIGVARSVGAMSPPSTPHSHLSAVQVVECTRIRVAACAALFALGKLLESCASPMQSTPRSASKSKASNTVNISKRRQLIVSAVERPAQSVALSNIGYAGGAYAAHYWCNQINQGSEPQYRKALSDSQVLLSSLSK